MKRITCLLLAGLILLSLCGCSLLNRFHEDDILFYYRRAVFDYHGEEPVMVAEPRQVAGHSSDLEYLLNLYLVGPLDEGLVSPFPAGTRLFRASAEDGNVELILSDLGASLSDAAFSLACACISMTCLSNTDNDQVTITSGQRTITITRESLLLLDTVTQLPEPTEETE